MRIHNFSAGPAVLPEPVLRRAADEMLDWHGSGMSVMEMSHRGKEFIAIAEKAEADLRPCCIAIPVSPLRRRSAAVCKPIRLKSFSCSGAIARPG